MSFKFWFSAYPRFLLFHHSFPSISHSNPERGLGRWENRIRSLLVAHMFKSLLASGLQFEVITNFSAELRSKVTSSEIPSLTCLSKLHNTLQHRSRSSSSYLSFLHSIISTEQFIFTHLFIIIIRANLLNVQYEPSTLFRVLQALNHLILI